jgi:hypothetical protein
VNMARKQEIQELKYANKLLCEQIQQQQDSPLVALVEQEGFMWSSEKSSNGQAVLSTEAALLFQDIHVRNGQSMEKLCDTIGAVLMATFGPR